MDLLNSTPFAVGYLLGKVHYPNPSLTVVVKGTFELEQGQPARPAPEQLPLAADSPDEDDGPVSLRYPADLVPFKPRADVLLVGSCHAGAKLQEVVPVTLRVGSWSKTLQVSGDRHWEVLGASRARPFDVVPLEYERAFGGPGFEENPVGVGFTPRDVQGVPVLRLPNIELPGAPLERPGARVPPAGFGPLRRHWAPRRSQTGTYDARWREQRWPWYPEDFDFGHFNVAPVDMQLPYLRGDEAVVLTNLHPAAASFTSALPGVRVRCFVADAAAASAAGPLRELVLQLDTAWIDAEASRLVLVWRGVLDVRSDGAEEVRHLYISREPLASASRPLSECRAELDALLAAGEADEVPEPEPPAPPVEDAALDASMAEAEQRAFQQMREAGIDPERLPVATPEQQRADRAHLLALGFDPEDAPPAQDWTRTRVESVIAQRASFAGANLAGLDLSGLDLSGLDFSAADLRGANLAHACLKDATFSEAALADANLSGAELTGCRFLEADLTGANLSGARGSNVVFDGAVLELARFVSANIAAFQARGASGPGVDFSGATLAGAQLDAARLPGCQLAGTDLRGASLKEATIEGAAGVGLDARGADLSELRAAEGTVLTRARLDGANAAGANLEGAALAGATLAGTLLRDANLSRADLSNADLSSAVLRSAKLTSANLEGARLVFADLFEADLEGVNARRADFSNASLFGAETWKADLAGAHVRGANVLRTKLADGAG